MLVGIVERYKGRSENEKRREISFKASAWLITFIAFATYHISRKVISVAKGVLHQGCLNETVDNTSCSWPPFDQPDYQRYFGYLDFALLASYSLGLFASGFIAERVNMKYFLTAGLFMMAWFTIMFGLGKYWNIHSLAYYVIVQIFTGLAQATGWPAAIAIVAYWFGRGNRGLVFGAWTATTSLGNILGSVVGGAFVRTNWALTFIVPGLINAAAGILVFLALVPRPEDVNCRPPNKLQPVDSVNENSTAREQDVEESSGRDDVNVAFDDSQSETKNRTENVSRQPPNKFQPVDNVNEIADERRTRVEVPAADKDHVNLAFNDSQAERANGASPSPETVPHDRHPDQSSLKSAEPKAIGFFRAWTIPEVLEYSLSLFFVKWVSYTFLFWLPTYIAYTTKYNAEESAYMSTFFDVGGIIGAISLGVISDKVGSRVITCVTALGLAVPMMVLYLKLGSSSLGSSVVLLIFCGALLDGTLLLIATAVSADLGLHPCLRGNARALATVTAIIDGVGSMGSAFGPLFASFVSPTGWNNVFYMMIAADIAALLLLLRLLVRDIQAIRRRRKELKKNKATSAYNVYKQHIFTIDPSRHLSNSSSKILA